MGPYDMARHSKGSKDARKAPNISRWGTRRGGPTKTNPYGNVIVPLTALHANFKN